MLKYIHILLTNIHKMHLIMLFWSIFVASVIAYNPSTSNFEANFNTAYPNVVLSNIELMYRFQLPDQFDPMLTKVQVVLTTNEETTPQFPLFATIIQSHEATSLELPFTMRASNNSLINYLNASRILCFQGSPFDEKHFGVRVFSSSVTPVTFELQVLKQDVMEIEVNVPVTTRISPTSPDFFYFKFPETDEEVHVKVQVTSPYETCSVLSIQPALCPVPYDAENVKVAGTQISTSKGYEWETLSTKGAIVTSNQLISTQGFFIVLLASKDYRQCGHLNDKDSPLITNLTIIVKSDEVIQIYSSFWKLPTALPIVINLIILLICGFVCVFTQRYCTRKITLGWPDPRRTVSDVTLDSFFDTVGRSSKHSIPSTYYGKMVIIIAIFFSIPVFELTTYHLTVLHKTGDNDICYYNSFCSHPLAYLKDFNHLWSNMGYIIFGFGFIGITYLKKKCSGNNKYAIPFKTGLYYTMGLGLIMEGFMSAAYHICPNKSNFQYDTCFMFIIAAMCILKIFDFRHPRHLGPNGIFTILSLFSLISATGIFLERYEFNYMFFYFRIGITIGHLYVVVFFSIYILYMGQHITNKKINEEIHTEDSEKQTLNMKESIEKIFLSSRKDIPTCLFICPNFYKFVMFKFRLHRFCSVIVFWLANAYVAINLCYLDFASGILRFLIINLIYYLVHYILIKLLVHHEFKYWSFRSMQPLVYFVATIIFGVVSNMYFKIDLTEWRKSAAYSREGNSECKLWNFYDEHDIWHMLSSVAIFFLYMTLLTLDDGVQDISEKRLMLI